MSANNIEIVDVSARDGLQNEKRLFSVPEKLRLIDFAINAGVKRIEVAGFVHPKYVPQMADAEAVITALPKRDDVTYVGLVLNERGLDRALDTGIDEIGCVVSASDGFGTSNQNQTRAQSVAVASRLIRRAKSESKAANVTISVAFGCPFDGEISRQSVVDIAQTLADAQPREIAIADTIGVADPWAVTEMMEALKTALPGMPVRAHFHDTRNSGLANVYAAVMGGAATIDACMGGIGGCPFAPGASGNVPAEDVLYMLDRAGITTGVELQGLIDGAIWLTDKMGRTLPGMVSRAGGFPV